MSTAQSDGADGVLVVLDHDQRVAQVAQPGQGLDQPAVVPLVQPDRRLVQHVEHADQAGADLGGQPDALRLAAGQRRRPPGPATGSQPDVEQEAQPGLHLLEHPPGDHGLPGVQLHAVEELRALGHRHARDTSAMDRSPCSRWVSVTASISGLSRAPWHAGQGTSRM